MKQKIVTYLFSAFFLLTERRRVLITNSYIRIMLWLRHKYVKARNCYQCQSIVQSDLQIIRLCSVYSPASRFMLHLAMLQPSVVQNYLWE